jgi:ABC-2 type transport system ATP-binding protein
VFLNASLLGLSRKEVEAAFDEIVAFAELEEHIDQQVKYYSSGMYVRLGFAVAVNLDPDILLVDEVLAVGDELFQAKCLDRVRRFQKEGRTIVFVTHSVDLCRQICDRVAVLDQGSMVALGPPGEAIRVFREHLLRHQRHEEAAGLGADADATAGSEAAEEADPRASSPIRISYLNFGKPNSEVPERVPGGGNLSVHIGWKAPRPIDDVIAGIAIYDPHGHVLFGTNTGLREFDLGTLQGEGEVVFSFPELPLLEGTYPLVVSLHNNGASRMYDWRDHEDWFEITESSNSVGALDLPVELRLVTGLPGGGVDDRAGSGNQPSGPGDVPAEPSDAPAGDPAQPGPGDGNAALGRGRHSVGAQGVGGPA